MEASYSSYLMLLDFESETVSSLMQKHLYFICPTDYLESIINDSFRDSNYFFSSLGNSVEFNGTTICAINGLIKKHKITAVTFILSKDNRIILDALGKQDFSKLPGLDRFYSQIKGQQEHSEVAWQKADRNFLILSNHLNHKIKKLQLEIDPLLVDPIRIKAKIYNRQEQLFYNIYCDLIGKEFLNLN